MKKPTNYAKGPQPVYLRISVNGQRVEISTQRECDPDRWNTSIGRALGTKEDIKILNAFLECLQLKVYEAHRLLMINGEIITAEKIKNKLLGIIEHPKMILQIFQEHNDQLEKLIGNEYAPLTLKRYKTAMGHVRALIKWKLHISDMEINSLDFELINSYESYHKSVPKCGHNSTMKYVWNFKKAVSLCIKRGCLQKNPFYGFKIAFYSLL